ncbi:hypothetical protein ACP4OV_019683 [Aristida adscensionis]
MDTDDHAGGGAGAGRVLEWEAGLPSPAELTPVSHPLIPRALAAAFMIDVAGAGAFVPSAAAAVDSPTSQLSFRFDEDEDDDDDDDGEVEEGEGETEDPAPGDGVGVCRDRRPGKKARMVWTPELHHRFVEAVAHLGDKGAVPKAIVRLMNVDGLTRENVASHLQKYRLYLKRTRAPAAPPPPPPAAYASPFGSPPPPPRGFHAFLSRDGERD